MNNIICLDIDDCIFLNTNSWVGELDDNFDLLEINLKRLRKVLDKFNAKIFITSSWYSILILENNNLIYNNNGYGLPGKDYYEIEYKAFQLIKKYLDGYVIGLSCGSRTKDIQLLCMNNQNKILALDDMDLSNLFFDNYLYLSINGLITNKDLCKINKFFEI